MVAQGLIKPEDMALVSLVDDTEAVIQVIRDFYANREFAPSAEEEQLLRPLCCRCDSPLRRAVWWVADPVFIPLGGFSVYPAWLIQCLSRLAGPVFIPLGGPIWRYMHQRYNTLTPVCRYRRDHQSNTGSS